MSNSNYPAYYTQSQGKRLEGYAFQNGKHIYDLMNLVKRENNGNTDEKNGIPITKNHKLSTKTIPLTVKLDMHPYAFIATSENPSPAKDTYCTVGYVYGKPSYVQYKYTSSPNVGTISTDVDYSDTYIIRFPYAKLPKYDTENNLATSYYVDVVPIESKQNILIQDAITGLVFTYNSDEKCWEATVTPYGSQHYNEPFISDEQYQYADSFEGRLNEESIAVSYSYFNQVLSDFSSGINEKLKKISGGSGNSSGGSSNVVIDINGEKYNPDALGYIDISNAFAKYLTKDDLPATPDLSQYAKKTDLNEYTKTKVVEDVVKDILQDEMFDYAKKTDIPSLNDYAKKTDIPAAPDLSGYAKTSDLPDMSQYAKKDELPEGVDLSEYAKKTDIPSAPDLSEYAKVTDIPAAPDLSDYAKKSEIPTAPDLTLYALKTELPPDSSKAITDHVAAVIPSENGLHGIRYYEGKLQVLVNENWNDIVAPSSGSDVTRKEFNALKSLVDSLSTGSGQSPVVEGVLTAGQTEITITSDLITEDSALRFYTSIYGVNPKEVHAEKGKVTLTFEAQDKDMTVGVQVVQKG